MILFLYNKLQDNKKLTLNPSQPKIIDNILGLKINIYIYIEIKDKIIKYKKRSIFNSLKSIYLTL